MGRLEPTQTKQKPAAAIEVKPNAAVEVKSSKTKPGKVEKFEWSDAGAQENQRRGEEAARANQKADKAASEAYRKYYESQTGVNGCTGVGVFPGWKTPPVKSACNDHDVAYGRGGSAADRLAADRALRRKIEANGEPVRAWVTYRGVRVLGLFFFSYRDKGPLPIPPGD